MCIRDSFAALGLNFRPVLTRTTAELRKRASDWAQQVLGCRGFYRAPEVQQAVLKGFVRLLARVPTRHSPGISPRRSRNAVSEEMLRMEAREITDRLVCTSTDKAVNACTIECKQFYRWVCLMRLESPAFSPLSATYAWACNAESDFSPAILFCTAKMHKRDADALAYRLSLIHI
eukprot:TRINITY_DN23224_c0_g2_i1.p1 TRINITY_DN23224_c0_g2~~TRINITY_DN23224_c0_g2_i1.p1  ORF type:complete len:196 (-),score=29.11 TRINITY_DN23224_c0_g2_i1:63-587(-)